MLPDRRRVRSRQSRRSDRLLKEKKRTELSSSHLPKVRTNSAPFFSISAFRPNLPRSRPWRAKT